MLDDECDSQVCRSDGSCEEAGNIVYASPDGLSSGDCTADAPCVVNFARTLLDASRATLRLANGTYVAVNDFVANGTAIAVVGGSSASVTFERSGLITPLFEARSGATLSLRGFALNEGVVSSGGSTVVITRLLFDHQSITVRPWISGSGTIEVRDSELRDSNSDGINATGTLRVLRTTIDGSAGNGIRCSTTCEISGSKIKNSILIGVTSTGPLEVLRSEIAGNQQGGIQQIGGSATIVNNFVFRNGNDKNGKFGGIRVEPSNGSPARIEHNTIVFNDSDPFASPAFAGGLYCQNATAPNNIIFSNAAGNNTMPNSQTGGVCGFNGSLIRNGDGTNELHFISPIAEPFDYHLADDQGPASNTGMSTTVTEDFDGDPRGSLPDIGADEFRD